MQFPPVSREVANKSVVFFTPLTDNITTRMVRTGTIADGSCFFHAVLHACSPKYVQSNIKERQEQVNVVRASIASNVNRLEWITEENISSVVMFQEAFHNNLENAYSHFTKAKPDSYIENLLKESSPYYTILVELIPFSVFKDKLLPSAYENVKNIVDCKEGVIAVYDEYIAEIKEIKKLERHKRIKALSAFTTFIITLLNDTEDRTFQHYIKSLKLPVDIDTYTIQAISDKLDLDIYFLDGNTRAPYRNASYDNIKKRKSIIILWVDGNHYEIVGELMPDNHVKRIFDFKDEIIQKIYGLLCDPSVIRSKYPDLVIYLPKEEQKIVDTKQTKLLPDTTLPSIQKQETPSRSPSSHHKSSDSSDSESEIESTSSSSESSSQSSTKHHRRKHKSHRPPSSWPSEDERESSTSEDEKKVEPPIVAKTKDNSIKQNIEKLDKALKPKIDEVKPITK
jgi:hypothetical protein